MANVNTFEVNDQNDPSALYPTLELAQNGQPSAVYVHHSRNESTVTATPSQAPSVTIRKSRTIDIFLYFGKRGKDVKKPSLNNCGPREKGTFLMVFILLIIFIISVTGFFVMWFTEMYNNSILSKLVITNNSVAVEWWKNPPINPELRIHILNYTNADRFLAGLDDKLHVEDIGPYVYVEKVSKVNVVFNSNYTISYREHRSYEFHPELSSGKQYDKIVVPNIPMLTAVYKLRYMNMLIHIGLKTILSSTNSGPFKVLPAHNFIWGYDDDLIEMSKNLAKFDEPLPFEKFGMLATRNGTSRDYFTIFSGEDDLKKLNVIDNFNGRPKLNLWGTDECNRVDGTDGTQFPPYLMDKKHPLYVFIKAFCRKFPLVYDSEVNIFDGVPAWRYKAPRNIFSHPDINPENQCFCHIESGSCAPSGVFNATKCFDAPIFSSFPHFLYGEPSLFRNIEGLEPDEKKHANYADIHPRLAFPIDGASRFQINVQVQKMNMISDLSRFENNQILPVLWMEVMSGELSEELRAMIYHSTFSANAIQLSLRYGTLLVCVISLAMLVAACYFRTKTNNDDEDEVQSKNEK